MLYKSQNQGKYIVINFFLVVNCAQADSDEVDASKVMREFSLFVDGVLEYMDFEYFETLFNKYGMVTKVGHRYELESKYFISGLSKNSNLSFFHQLEGLISKIYS